jgi:hypothetical protein
LIIAAITAGVVVGLSAMSGDDIEPFEAGRLWILVGIALAPILALAGVIWLVQRERHKARRWYFHDARLNDAREPDFLLPPTDSTAHSALHSRASDEDDAYRSAAE